MYPFLFQDYKNIPFCSKVYNSLDLSQNVSNALANSFTSFYFSLKSQFTSILKGYCLLLTFQEDAYACLVASVVSNCLRPHGPWPARLLCPWDSPGKNIGVGCHFLLQIQITTEHKSHSRLDFLKSKSELKGNGLLIKVIHVSQELHQCFFSISSSEINYKIRDTLSRVMA